MLRENNLNLNFKYLNIFFNIFSIALAFFAVFIIFENPAWAVGYKISDILDNAKGITSSTHVKKIFQYARSLFIGLATLSLAFGMIRMLLNAETTLGVVVGHLGKWILYTGIFSWIMSHNIHQPIINSFVQIGSAVGGTSSIAPDNILSAGIRIYGTMVQRGWEAGWGDFIGVALLGVIILVVVAMITGAFALVLIEMYMVICGGAILLGFAGFEYTRDIALSYIRYMISLGIKLIMIMLLYAFASSALPDWADQFSKLTDMTALITAAGQILGAVICLFMAVKHIPNIAQKIVNSAAMTFGAPAAQLIYTSSPGSEGKPAIIESNGGIVSALMDSLRSSRVGGESFGEGGGAGTGGGAAGLGESSEGYVDRGFVRGQDGMLSGADYGSLTDQGGAPHVTNPANAAAMINYASPDASYGGGMGGGFGGMAGGDSAMREAQFNAGSAMGGIAGAAAGAASAANASRAASAGGAKAGSGGDNAMRETQYNAGSAGRGFGGMIGGSSAVSAISGPGGATGVGGIGRAGGASSGGDDAMRGTQFNAGRAMGGIGGAIGGAVGAAGATGGARAGGGARGGAVSSSGGGSAGGASSGGASSGGASAGGSASSGDAGGAARTEEIMSSVGEAMNEAMSNTGGGSSSSSSGMPYNTGIGSSQRPPEEQASHAMTMTEGRSFSNTETGESVRVGASEASGYSADSTAGYSAEAAAGYSESNNETNDNNNSAGGQSSGAKQASAEEAVAKLRNQAPQSNAHGNAGTAENQERRG